MNTKNAKVNYQEYVGKNINDVLDSLGLSHLNDEESIEKNAKEEFKKSHPERAQTSNLDV